MSSKGSPHPVVVINRAQANALKWVSRKCPTWPGPPGPTLQGLLDRGLIKHNGQTNEPWETTALGNATMGRYEATHPAHKIPREKHLAAERRP